MKIELLKDSFIEAVVKAERVVSKNNTLPILRCLLISATNEGEIIIQATNGELGLRISTSAKVLQEGVVAVPASALLQSIQSIVFDKKIHLSLEGNNLHIQSTKYNTIIKTLPHADFPSVPVISAKNTFSIASADLVEGLSSVAFCAAQSSIKPELSSVYIYSNTDLVFVATDSFRLAEKKIRIKKELPDFSVLIPSRNVPEIIRTLSDLKGDIEVSVADHQISFQQQGIYLTSRIIDGTFPDYRQIIPKGHTTRTVALVQDIQQALKSASIFSDRFQKLTISVVPLEKHVVFKTSNPDVGETTNAIDATIEGDSVEINFNFRYIADAFAPIEASSVEFILNGVNKILIRGYNDPNYQYIVMPMNR